MKKETIIRKLSKGFEESYKQNGLNEDTIESFLGWAFDCGVAYEERRKIKPNKLKSHIKELKKSKTKLYREDGERMEHILELLLENPKVATNLYWDMDTVVRDDFFEMFTNNGKIEYNKNLLINKLGIVYTG